MLNEIVQTALSGIAIGCIYGLVALGFVLIYKATEVINFAQGEMMVLGAFLTYSLISAAHFPWWAALLVTTLLMGLFGTILERVVLRPLIGEPVFAIVMLTIGSGVFHPKRLCQHGARVGNGYLRGFKTPFTDKVALNIVQSGGCPGSSWPSSS